MELPDLGWLPWRQALVIAAVVAACSLILSLVRRRSASSRPRLDSTILVLRELALILALYAAWQYVGSLSIGGLEQADAAGMWLADLEAALRWPSEAAIQQAVLGNDAIIHLADVYYTGLHIPVFVITLIWVLLMRRDHWAFTRTTVALLMAMCLLIQLKPVAPPRLLPSLGIVDTALVNGRSVYALVPGANEYAAMPSVHIAWAAAVAMIVIIAVRSPWRWLVLLYPLATLWVVIVTGNHFIIDGVVSVVLLGLAAGLALLIPSQRPPLRR
jgi:hypothetical protein